MDKAKFEELVLTIAAKPSLAMLDTLAAELKSAVSPLSAEINASLAVLWEKWSNSELDTASAEICCTAAAAGVADTPEFRKLLVNAAKALLPNDLGHNPIMRALGVRDEKIQLPEVAKRLRRLLALKNNTVVFLPASGRWGVCGSIDPISGAVPIKTFRGIGANSSVPLESVLKDVVCLELDTELEQLVLAGTSVIPSQKFREIVKRRARFDIDDAQMRAMALSGCARRMAPTAFDAYWSTAAAASNAQSLRTSSAGRSLLEMDQLLTAEEASGAGEFTTDDLISFRAFFVRLKPDTALRESKILGEIISKIASRCPRECWKELFAPLETKAPFWPADIVKAPWNVLGVWGDLSAKAISKVAEVTCEIFSIEYASKAMMRLPLKALNGIGLFLSDDDIYDVAGDWKTFTPDIRLWIWKNAKKRKSESLPALVTVENVCRVLSGAELPKAWSSARRELRNLLMDNAQFQTRMVESACGNMKLFTSVLQGALFLSASERQSLMVKLSSISPALRAHIEGGAGKLILKAGVGKTNVGDAPAEEVPNLTSVKSHRRLVAELEDIINVQIPENREALKIARAHGDFRENSEFDAAKERRNHLGRRRSELEKELAQLQSIILKNVTVKDTAVVGSAIELKYADGKVENYMLLGSWDGDPDRKFLSFKTRLGSAVLNKKVGETFDAPGGKCTLVSVGTLPAELIAELDD